MNADISADSPRFLLAPLPRDLIPGTAARNVDEGHLGTARIGLQALAQGDQLLVDPELQDGKDAAAGLKLQFLQRVEVPRVDDDRLLADHVRAVSKSEADVGVVEVVRAADRDPVDALFLPASTELVHVAIEALDLSESSGRRSCTGPGCPRNRWGRPPRQPGCPSPESLSGGGGRRSRPRQ